MKSLLTVTLDAKQVREACAAFVKEQVGYDLKDQAFATLGADNGLSLTVVVTKKRIRKAKGA